jgi:hypothetical protein
MRSNTGRVTTTWPRCIHLIPLQRIVQRNRPVITLAVYTGDNAHKVYFLVVVRDHLILTLSGFQITVTALSLSSNLSPQDAHSGWDLAINHLRKDGATPRQVRSLLVMF